jgi:hypothetical protein
MSRVLKHFTSSKPSKRPSPTVRTGAVLGLTALLAGTVLALPSEAASAKAGGLCSKSQLGKSSGSLVCRKSGSRYRWFKKTSTTSSGGGAVAGSGTGGAPISGSTPGLPAAVGISVIPFGPAPATASTKIDLSCSGLAGTVPTGNGTLSFPAAGGSNQISLALQAPSSSNPTGSTCTATATSSTPANLRVLVDGAPSAGPAATTITTPAFTTQEGTKITVLVDYSANSGAAAQVTLPTVAAPVTTAVALPATTLLGASTTTTTISGALPVGGSIGPVSGKPEITSRYLTTLPGGFTGMSVDLTCTPGPLTPGAYQTQSFRFDRINATAYPSLNLGGPGGGFGGTACTSGITILGDASVAGATTRVLLNGLPIANGTGTSVSSGNFEAAKPFALIIEVTFPGQTPASTIATTATTLVGSAATTTIAAGVVSTAINASTTTSTAAPSTATQGTVTLTRTGTPPANLDGYDVVVTCTNATLSGVAQTDPVKWTAKFPASGASTNLPVGQTANSLCSVSVQTLSTTGTTQITTGTIVVSVSGVVRASGAAAAFSASFPAPSTIAVAITVAY